MNNADMPAMPGTVWAYDGDGNAIQTMGGGLTKREYFAGLAMQGLLANPERDWSYVDQDAEVAVHAADCLLEELERTGGEP